MTHIAFLLPTLDQIGGAERQVLQLATGLQNRGWHVELITLSGSGGAALAELTAAGIPTLSLHMRRGLADPRGWMRWRKWLRQSRPDIVHAHLPHAAWLARCSRWVSRSTRVVDTVHTSARGPWTRQWLYRLTDLWSDRVTVVGREAADSYLSARIIRRSHLRILPNGVDTSYWVPDTKARTTRRAALHLENEFLWFAAGRLNGVKDYPALLCAIGELPHHAFLVIAGTGPQATELRDLSHRYGLDGRVRFLGFERDVRSWMQAADGLVLASRWEGLPLCLLEAGSCALPAVATDVPGSREVILHNQTGYLAPSRQPRALQTAMLNLMNLAPADRAAIGQRARARVIAHYDMESVLDQWEELYLDLGAAPTNSPTSRSTHLS